MRPAMICARSPRTRPRIGRSVRHFSHDAFPGCAAQPWRDRPRKASRITRRGVLPPASTTIAVRPRARLAKMRRERKSGSSVAQFVGLAPYPQSPQAPPPRGFFLSGSAGPARDAGQRVRDRGTARPNPKLMRHGCGWVRCLDRGGRPVGRRRARGGRDGWPATASAQPRRALTPRWSRWRSTGPAGDHRCRSGRRRRRAGGRPVECSRSRRSGSCSSPAFPSGCAPPASAHAVMPKPYRILDLINALEVVRAVSGHRRITTPIPSRLGLIS